MRTGWKKKDLDNEKVKRKHLPEMEIIHYTMLGKPFGFNRFSASEGGVL